MYQYRKLMVKQYPAFNAWVSKIQYESIVNVNTEGCRKMHYALHLFPLLVLILFLDSISISFEKNLICMFYATAPKNFTMSKTNMSMIFSAHGKTSKILR